MTERGASRHGVDSGVGLTHWHDGPSASTHVWPGPGQSNPPWPHWVMTPNWLHSMSVAAGHTQRFWPGSYWHRPAVKQAPWHSMPSNEQPGSAPMVGVGVAGFDVGVTAGVGVGGTGRAAGTHKSAERFATVITRAPN